MKCFKCQHDLRNVKPKITRSIVPILNKGEIVDHYEILVIYEWQCPICKCWTSDGHYDHLDKNFSLIEMAKFNTDPRYVPPGHKWVNQPFPKSKHNV